MSETSSKDRLRRRLARPGFVLVQLILVISLMTLLMAVSTSTLLTLFRADRTTRRQSLHNTTLWRLSRQLREDVHATRAADLTQTERASRGPDRLVLHLPDDRRIEYQLQTTRILRTVIQATATRYRESYAMPVHGAARWQRQSANGRRTVSLVLPRKVAAMASENQTRQTLRIIAVVGLDHRFQQREDRSKESRLGESGYDGHIER